MTKATIGGRCNRNGPTPVRPLQHWNRGILQHHLVEATAPQMLGMFGIGTDTDAALIAIGDNPEWIRSKPTAAKLAAVGSIPVGKGRTDSCVLDDRWPLR